MVAKITNHFKEDYFIRNLVDLEKTFAQYLADADYNYVIIYKGAIDTWAGDECRPVIYGDEQEVINETYENGKMKDEFEVMTEQEFLINFCLDGIVEYLFKKVMNINYFDGVNYILHFDNSFNGIIDIDGMTDILNICTDEVRKNVSFLISNEDDTKQDFCYLGELMEHTENPIDFLIKIVDYVEKNGKPTITPKGFLTDLYDLLVRNTKFITEEQFYDKYVKNDNTIYIDTTDKDNSFIEFDDFKLVVIPK